MTVIKIVFFIVALVVCGVFFTLFANQANMFDEPGLGKRLAVFLTTNRAETADDPEFKELETPVYQLEASLLYKQMLLAAAELGWDIVSHDSDNLSAEIIVRSRVFLFEDDVFIQVMSRTKDISSMYVVSSSRKGRSDLAANSGHIQELIYQIRKNNQ